MHSLFKRVGLGQALRQELGPFFVSLVIAEILYKWGSFSLELVGFIATWWVLGAVYAQLMCTLGQD